MTALLRMELGKLTRLASLRFSLLLLVLFPLLWSYAPGIFEVYGFYLVSGYQVPGLSLLSSIEVLLPLLVAITSAELLGIEMNFGTLPTILLRPVSRSRWLLAKLLVATLYPFLLLLFLLLVSLLAGAFYGYGPFVGGTGLGAGGILGAGMMQPGSALLEIVQAYGLAGLSLIPISLLAVLFTVVFMSAAGGALATLGILVASQLLVVFPALEDFLPHRLLQHFADPVASTGWLALLIAVYATAFAVGAVVLFERKDF